jgi:hypothetical protein
MSLPDRGAVLIVLVSKGRHYAAICRSEGHGFNSQPHGNLRPLEGINVLMLWSASIGKGYAAPIWMTFKQTLEPNATSARVRRGNRICDLGQSELVTPKS